MKTHTRRTPKPNPRPPSRNDYNYYYHTRRTVGSGRVGFGWAAAVSYRLSYRWLGGRVTAGV